MQHSNLYREFKNKKLAKNFGNILLAVSIAILFLLNAHLDYKKLTELKYIEQNLHAQNCFMFNQGNVYAIENCLKATNR